MKALARLLVTATALATLSVLGAAATATASPLVDGPQLSASAQATGHQAELTCNSGHGPQVDCSRPASPAASPSGSADTTADAASRVARLVLASIALGALVTVVGTWFRRHRRLGEVV
jgi:hypothetical protein